MLKVFFRFLDWKRQRSSENDVSRLVGELFPSRVFVSLVDPRGPQMEVKWLCGEWGARGHPEIVRAGYAEHKGRGERERAPAVQCFVF